MLFNKSSLLALSALAYTVSADTYPILGASKIVGGGNPNHNSNLSAVERFELWATQHGKNYSSSTDKERRMEIWMQTDREINEHNAKGLSWWEGHNEWSDWTQEEWEEYFHLDVPSVASNPLVPPPGAASFNAQVASLRGLSKYGNIPDEVNYVADGHVTEVKFQKACGSCWAFGAVAAMEVQHSLAGFGLVDMSEQELVDCDDSDNGCQGGFYMSAWGWTTKQEGVCSEDSYPYTGKKGTCGAASCTLVENSKFSTYQYAPKNDVDGLRATVANEGAVVVALESTKIKKYAGGVYDGDCTNSLTHAMTVVGYKVEAGDYGDGYFLMKNSWGAAWGESGFMKIAYKASDNGGDGKCGILMYPAYISKP